MESYMMRTGFIWLSRRTGGRVCEEYYLSGGPGQPVAVVQYTFTHKQYTENTINLGKVRPCPVFAIYTLTLALQLRKKQGKTSVRVAEECQLARRKENKQKRTNRIHRTEQQNIQNRTTEYTEQNNRIYRTEQQNMQNRTTEYAEQNNRICRTEQQNIQNRNMGSHITEYALIVPLTYER